MILGGIEGNSIKFTIIRQICRRFLITPIKIIVVTEHQLKSL